MQVGMVGLGRMGGNMARRLMRGGHEVVAHAADASAVRQLASEGARGAATLDELVGELRAPRVAWVMVPAGAATEQVVADLGVRMEPGDTIIDGGNSHYKDDVRRQRELAQRRIHFADVGTSGGVWGLERGYCLSYVRFRSRQEHTFAEKVLSAMREKFGGHVELPSGG